MARMSMSTGSPALRSSRGALLFALALTCGAAAQSRNPLELASWVPPEEGRRIAYGKEALHFGELRVPSTPGPHPVAIVVHGGCWLAQIGKMDPRAVSFENMRPLAVALTSAGIATWNIEYRRLGHSGGGWPGTFQDVARGADHVREIAREHRLDLTRAISIGHSAGGHFALWLAARPKLKPTSELYLPDPLKLSGAVSLDGPGDLKATIALQQPVCGQPVITNLVGGSPETHAERYQDASPIEMLPFGMPQVFFAGRMFGDHAAPYEEATRRSGDTIQTTVLPTAGHFVFIDPQSDTWPSVLKAVQSLLRMSPQ